IESVKGVEELLLHRLLTLEKVHVVHEQEVGFAEASAKIGGRAVLDRRDQLVGELLGTDEGDSRFWLPEPDLVGDCLHEVCLAEAGVAVDEEGVVDFSGGLSHCMRGGSCQLVGLADDEVLERVSIAQWWRIDAAILSHNRT